MCVKQREKQRCVRLCVCETERSDRSDEEAMEACSCLSSSSSSPPPPSSSSSSASLVFSAQSSVTFKSRRQVSLPFRRGSHPPEEYVEHVDRFVKVTFPDSARIRFLGDSTWRATLKPVRFFHLSATPLCDLRYAARPYPPRKCFQKSIDEMLFDGNLHNRNYFDPFFVDMDLHSAISRLWFRSSWCKYISLIVYREVLPWHEDIR